MLRHLGGMNKKFFVFKDTELINQLYDKCKEDIFELGRDNDCYFQKEEENDDYKAICCVFHCKKTKDQRARLVVAAGIQINVPLDLVKDVKEPVGFMRMFHLPCKCGRSHSE